MFTKSLGYETQSKIDALARTLKKTKRFDDVTPLTALNRECQEIVELTLSSMDIETSDWVRASEDGLYGFHNVPMHTGSVNPISVVTLLIPVKGRGELACFEKGRIKQYLIQGSRSMGLLLDDHQPHSFSTLTNCYAILSAVKRDAVSI